ncbi:MAG TPA: PHP domain-containing protein [Anaeromyxobacteraceae bacterium]|nr:PHP domain-containing protein [Anaeromyxobacteraceae bacterium]
MNGKALIAAGILATGAYVAFGLRVRSDRAVRVAPPAGEIRGAYHVHTRRSDGRGSLDDAVRAAKEAGLQFLVVTDHNVLVPEEQGYRDDILVVEATETSTPFGHVVALGVPRALTAAEREGDALGAIRALGGVAVVAHPFHPRRPFTGWDRGPWRGFEVVSNDTAWHSVVHEHAVGKVAAAALALPWDSARAVLALSDSPDDELQRFDDELRNAAAKPGAPSPAKVLLCSADAHGYPSYRAAFEAFSMHLPLVLSGDGARDARAVIEALARGRGTCVFDGEAPGRVLRLGRGRKAGTLEAGPASLLWGATSVLVRDGAVVSHVVIAGPNAALGVIRCEDGCRPGYYRLELWRGDRPWIFTNPVAIE